MRKWTDTKPISLKDKRKLNPTEKEKTLQKKVGWLESKSLCILYQERS